MYTHVANCLRNAFVIIRIHVIRVKIDTPRPTKVGARDEPTMEPRLTPEHALQEHAHPNQTANNDAERSGVHPSDRRALDEKCGQPDSSGKEDKGGDVDTFELHTGVTPTQSQAALMKAWAWSRVHGCDA